MPEPVVVVGASVAAAVAAERLAARGEHVRWLHAGALGAGFRRLEVSGRSVNLGPRLIELSYEATAAAAPEPAWSSYRARHDGHRPWQARVARYLRDLLEEAVREVPVPELVWRGARGADIYFTGDLRALPGFLDPRTLAAVATETAAILTRAPAGGVHHDGSDLDDIDLTAASLANHGPTFHRAFVDVLARRLRSAGTDGVAASLHNKLWMPLYWPRTLWQAAAGEPVTYTPDRAFYTDASGGMSLLMERLEARLRASQRVEAEPVGRLVRIARDAARSVLTFADGTTVTADRAVVGSTPEELFAAAGIEYAPARLDLRLVWIEVATPELALPAPSALTVVDDESAIYRVTDAGDGAAEGHAIYTLELAAGHPEPTLPELARQLVGSGFLRPGAEPRELGRRAIRAFADPSIANRRQFDRALSAFQDQLAGLPLVGAAAGFGADPLNEQVLQGIRIAEVLP